MYKEFNDDYRCNPREGLGHLFQGSFESQIPPPPNFSSLKFYSLTNFVQTALLPTDTLLCIFLSQIFNEVNNIL